MLSQEFWWHICNYTFSKFSLNLIYYVVAGILDSHFRFGLLGGWAGRAEEGRDHR